MVEQPVTFMLFRHSTYADAVASMRRVLCPQANRENFFAEFESRILRPEEDPSVYKWELENILSKADSTLSADAKTALLTRQFSRDLPPSLKLKMLEHNILLPVLLKWSSSLSDFVLPSVNLRQKFHPFKLTPLLTLPLQPTHSWKSLLLWFLASQKNSKY